MRNFIIILFILFLTFITGSLFINDPLLLFLTIFMAFLIAFICAGAYFGAIKGPFFVISFIILPFFLEYIFYKFNLPLFNETIIKNLTFKQISLPFTQNTLFALFTIPLLFVTALIYSQKIRLVFDIKKYVKIYLVAGSSLLVAINFLALGQAQFNITNFAKWLIISLLVYLLLSGIISFKPVTSEIYKELPIILYLAIFGVRSLKDMAYYSLYLVLMLTVLYLIILYREHRYRQVIKSKLWR